MKSIYVILGLSLFLSIQATYAWKLDAVYQGTNFFDNFNFWTQDEPTDGYVNYVDENTAKSRGYAKVSNNVAIISTDTKNVASGRGRDSVRLHSKQKITQGSVVIIDLQHMPTGCGTWNNIWTSGDIWPQQGEIDIIEGVNNQQTNLVSLHTNAGCWMDPSFGWQQIGRYDTTPNGGIATNCDVNDPNQYPNQGCALKSLFNSPYGQGFNVQGGGVYALVWTESLIAIYHFQRAGIPADILSQNPKPESWGKPTANFMLGRLRNCPSEHFGPQNLIINLSYCGNWAGDDFEKMCPGKGSCTDYVKNNPSAFNDAFWAINSIKIYKQ